MKRAWVKAILLAGSIASLSAAPLQDEPAKKMQVNVSVSWCDTTADLWDDLRAVDPAFRTLGIEVAQIAKGFESDEIAVRGRAAAQLKALGLSAYGALKEARDKATAPAVKAELEAVMAALAGKSALALPSVPAARTMGAKEGAALRKRLADNKRITQGPMVSVVDGDSCSIFVGDTIPVPRGKVIELESGEGSVHAGNELTPEKRGIEMSVLAKVLDTDKRTVWIHINAVSLGPVTETRAEKVAASLKTTLASGEFCLAGPFPPAEEKGEPWWILVGGELIKP